jgi:long-chain acyl-CoA synthetase
MGILILEGYGLTETPSVTSVNRVDDFSFGTVGKPSRRRGEDRRRREILIRGPLVFKEYFRNPAATREAIDLTGGSTPETSARSIRQGSCGSRTGRRTSS